MTKGLTLLFICMTLAQTLHAELDSASTEALKQTNEILIEKNKRTEAIKNDPQAKKADDYVKSVGGKNSEEIYSLSAKIFEKLVKKYNGDTTKIQEVLVKALSNPEGFANSEFSAEDLNALRELAEKLPKPISNK